MTDEERIDFMKKALTAQQKDNWEEAKMQARLRDTYRQRMESWRHLV